MNRKISVVIFWVLGIIPKYVFTVDEHTIKKLSCFEPTPMEVDKKWFNSVLTWYNPMSNKMDIYRISRELLRAKAEDIPDYDIYYEACITYHPNLNGDGYAIRGFDGHETRIKSTPDPDKPHVQKIRTDSADYKLGVNGTSTIIMTDNKSYVMYAICDRSVMVWKVWSVGKRVSDKIAGDVFIMASNMGFHRENFVLVRYDYCDRNRTS